MSSIIPRNPSATFIALNPHLFGGKPLQELQKEAHVLPPIKSVTRSLSAPKLNKTEQRWQDTHPCHMPFPMSLRWGNCMTYKPDFLRDSDYTNPCSGPAKKPVLIEVKGGHIYDRDIVRFKGCAAEWKWLFQFELWQWKDRKWTQLY